MSEALFGVADCGGTVTRAAVYDEDMRPMGEVYTDTDVTDYYGTVNGLADNMRRLAEGKGELVAASIAVAGEIDKDGRLVRAGGLTPWLGRFIGLDVAQIMNMPFDRVGLLNDMEAVARGQQAANAFNRAPADGIVSTVSSGWGAAEYFGSGGVKTDEPGHEYLRDGAICPCGVAGHAEAFISGKGVETNQGMQMKDWLASSENGDQFVTDVSTAVVAMLERHAKAGFSPEEIRWMGGVAANQPLLMWRAAEAVRRQVGPHRMPAWESVTLGHQAGLYGTFSDARERARAA